MSIVGRYLAKEIAAAVFFVLLGFLALFAFFDFINELEDIGRGGYGLLQGLAHVLLGLPSHIYELMPIAALIGSIYALAQFAQHSEFTAMRAAGLGRRRALTEVAKVGIGFALLTALVGEVLAPPSERLAQSVRLGAMGTAVGGQFRSGLWLKDSQRDASGAVSSLRFVNVGELLPDGTLRRVRVFEFDAEMRLRQIVHAGRAEIAPPDAWRLTEVRWTRFSPVALPEGAPALRAEQDRPDELLWKTELRSELLSVLLVAPDKMSGTNLFRYIRHLRENQQSTNRYEIAFWKKVVYPLAVVVMIALALPFAYLQARAGGIGYKVFAGIMIGVSFHFLNGLFAHIGLLNTWPPLLTVSLPSMVAMVLAIGMLAWVDRTR